MIVTELSNGPNEIDKLAKALKLKADDLIYHLLVLQNQGVAKSSEIGHDHYSMVWALA